MPIITNITTNEHYFYYVIEIDNSLTHLDQYRYIIEMPPAVGHNFRYNEMCFDVKTTDDFGGIVDFSFSQVFTDSENGVYEIPVVMTLPQDKSNFSSMLSAENNNQTWKMHETSMKKLFITFTQTMVGTGKIFLIIRGAI